MRSSSGTGCLKPGGTRSEQAQQHLQQMLRLGLPTRKHENWKYTPLDGLLNAEFVTRLADLTPAQRDALAVNVDAVRWCLSTVSSVRS